MNTITLLILCQKEKEVLSLQPESVQKGSCPRNKETKECIHEYEKGI